VDGTTVRAGVIGELGICAGPSSCRLSLVLMRGRGAGCTYPLYPNEQRVLVAGARAQSATGAGMIIHPGRNEVWHRSCRLAA
jgi:predicted metal-dependent phosphotriesterase family hydrolase